MNKCYKNVVHVAKTVLDNLVFIKLYVNNQKTFIPLYANINFWLTIIFALGRLLKPYI